MYSNYRSSNITAQRTNQQTLSSGADTRTVEMAGLFGSSAASAASANPTQGDLSKDVAITNPPEDSISDMCFSPASDQLAVSSWDKKVRIYEIDGNGISQGTAYFEFGGPALNCCWSKVSTIHISRLIRR